MAAVVFQDFQLGTYLLMYSLSKLLLSRNGGNFSYFKSKLNTIWKGMLLSSFIITGAITEHGTDPPLVFDVQMKETVVLLAENHMGCEGSPEDLCSLPLLHQCSYSERLRTMSS